MHLKSLLTRLGILLATAVLSSAQLLAAEPSKNLPDVRIEDIAADDTSFTVTICSTKCDGEAVKIYARDTGAQKELKNFKKGDRVSLQITSDNILQTISIRALPVSSGKRTLVLGVSAAAYLLLITLLGKFHPLRFVTGQDGRYSNSQFQIALWFSVVIVTYIAAIYLRAAEAGREFLGGVNIPQNLLLLSGMSALTLGGAKGITARKVQIAMQGGGANPKVPAAAPSFWNLVQDDKGFYDVGDFQMLVVTFLAVGMYLVLIFNFLGSVEMRTVVDLPNVDTTILAAFGLGHGAYLAKKAAGTPGQS